MNRTATKTDFRRMPRRYANLVAMLPPRPVHDDTDLANATEMIDRLAGHDLNSDQEDYLEALSTFVEVYEHHRYPMDDSRITPLETLKFLLSEHGMTASDLGRLLGNRTLGAAILRGERGLSKTHIRKLAEHFKVQPGLFL
jgi:antitoxin component HigA of HigAB toxin-antitoxin module